MIDAKIRLTAQFSEAIRALEGLAAEFKAVQAQAQGMNSGAATEGLTNGLQEAKAQAKETAAKVRSVGEAAAKSGAEGQALAQGLNQGLDQAQAKAEQATKQTQALGQAAANASQAGAKAQAAARGVADETAKGLKASENQMRMLGPQLTDIAVGLSTGQSPLMVLLQQGGQLKDMFGGIGGALRALSSVITPLTLIGAGLATLAVAAYQSYQNSDALNKALALTGNVAGQTSGQLTLLAQQLAQSQNASIGASKEALAAAVATGAFGAQTLASAGKAALALSKLTGQSADEIVKDFAQMSGGVTEWATKSDAAMNFLSLAQLRLVRDLEATGQKQEAMRVVLEALNDTIKQRSVPALNEFGKALNSIGNAGSGFWDWVKSLTRADTVEEKLAKLSQRMAELKARRDNLDAPRPYRQAASEDLEKAQKEFAALEALRQAGAKSAEEEAKQREKDQDGKIKDRKDYQAALAQVDQAGAQYLLAQQLAALDEAQGNLDVAHAKGLLSEEQYGLRQNAIELKRLEAQKATTERRIELARRASEKIESPIEKMGAQAAIKQLESELVAVQGRIKQAAAQGRAISADAALNDDRERANSWMQLWQQAFMQVRQFANANAATDAARLTDPIKAAEAVALARVESAKQQLKDLQDSMDREISLLKGAANKADSPDKRDAFNDQAASLQAKREELALSAKLAIDEQARQARQSELKNSLGVATEALKIKEEELTQAVQQGVTTTTDGEAKKFAARRAAIPQLEAILAALESIAKTPEELNAVAGWKQKIRELKNEASELQLTMRDSLKGGFSQLFSDVATGAKNAGDAVRDFVSGVAKSMLDLIAKRLGEQLMNSLMGESAGGSGGWIGAAASFIYDAFAHHTGGVVGQAGMPVRVPVAAFAGAPRYHSGGIAGLKPNERPAVLLAGEEVLTEDDPRHVRNLKSRSSSGVQVGDITVNVTTQGTGTPTGDKDLGKRLGDGIKSVVYSILVNESREGGLLAKGVK